MISLHKMTVCAAGARFVHLRWQFLSWRKRARRSARNTRLLRALQGKKDSAVCMSALVAWKAHMAAANMKHTKHKLCLETEARCVALGAEMVLQRLVETIMLPSQSS